MLLLLYFSKASLLLLIFWVVYKLLLENETYNRLKRIYLLLGYLVSAILPLITYKKIIQVEFNQEQSILQSKTGQELTNQIEQTPFETLWSIITNNHLIEVFIFGITGLYLIRFAIKLYKLIYHLKSSLSTEHNGIIYIKSNTEEVAFSFLNYIVYNPEKITDNTKDLIIKHEQAHVRLKHSIDNLTANLFTALFWFNPFAWFYQKSVLQNLEFQADEYVSRQEDLSAYQMALYQAAEQQYHYQLQQQFNQHSIKKRIMMLQKTKQRFQKNYFKLVIIAPLIALFFMLFQVETVAQVNTNNSNNEFRSTLNKVELKYDETTNIEEIRKDIKFLKEELNVTMTYKNDIRTADGMVKAITLEIRTSEGDYGSVSSSDLKKNPIYAYYYPNPKEGQSPFRIGTGKSPLSSNSSVLNSNFSASTTTSSLSSKEINAAEIYMIDGQRYRKSELKDSYIGVGELSYNSSSKTLNITSPPKFNEAIFSNFKSLFTEVKSIYGNSLDKNEKLSMLWVKENEEALLITMNDFKIDNTPEQAVQYSASAMPNLNQQNLLYFIDNKKVEAKEFRKINPKKIKSVEVIKDKSKMKEYTSNPKDYDGVILLTLLEK